MNREEKKWEATRKKALGPYRTFEFVLRNREPEGMHDDDIIFFLDTLQGQKKSITIWIKQAIREKIARVCAVMGN